MSARTGRQKEHVLEEGTGVPEDATLTPDPLLQDAQYLPVPPDGGYGWVIVAASFLGLGLLDGIPGMCGVLMPNLLDTFKQGRAKTALASSIFVGVMLLGAPLAGILTNLVGCRPVAMAGGIIMSIGCFASAYAPNLEVYIFTFGAVGGLGAGMLFVPCCVMPGYYFDMRRSVATGIAYSGAGLGLVVLPQLTALGLSLSDWRSITILLAGILLQSVIMGALMRPLTWSMMAAPDLESSLIDGEKLSPLLENETKFPNDKSHHQNPKSSWNNSLPTESDSGVGLSREQLDHTAPGDTNGYVQSCYEGIGASSHNYATKPAWAKKNIRGALGSTSMTLAMSPKNIRSTRTTTGSSAPPPTVAPFVASCYEFRKIPLLADRKLPTTGGFVDRKRMLHDLQRPLARQDAFYTGSIATLTEFRSQPNMASYVSSILSLPAAGGQGGSWCCGLVKGGTLEALKSMLDLSILLDTAFLIQSVCGVGIQFGYFVPVVFIGEHAKSLGISVTKSATLVAVFGITNCLGRIASGALSNMGVINPLHIYALSLIAAGVTCGLGVTFCTSFLTLAVYIGAYGFLVAMFVPVTTILLVKYLGLARLTNAFGYLSFFKGIAGIVGPVITGALLDATNSFQIAYYFGAGALILAGLSSYLLPIVSYFRRRQGLE